MTEHDPQPAMADIAVIGGGINGCGIARDAAGRGLSVVVLEQGDLASATSSASTKLIHGGLRYLEHYAFRLVRESLIEREVLLRAAPHIIRPMRFVLPHHDGLRPAWLIRLGLFLYDHLGGRRLLPPTRVLNLREDPAGAPLKGSFRRGFEYSDCRVDDARLVVLNAVDARRHGATIRTRTEVIGGERHASHWNLHLLDHRSGRRETIAARVVINAAGPWVSDTLQRLIGSPRSRPLRLVQGSHIIVRRALADEIGPDRAYIFQTRDKRIVFAIPYERDLTLIGTTDVDFHGDPGSAQITDAEIDYLCTVTSEYFDMPITRRQVVSSYSGVRALFDDGARSAQSTTRDYLLDRDPDNARAALLSIYGGKITTFRRLAEHALEGVSDVLPKMGPRWTHDAPLPGGGFPIGGEQALAARIIETCPSCPPERALRFATAYGTRSFDIVAGITSETGWGHRFGGDLTERELRYLMREEWAETAEDVIWRRSKLGYRMSRAQIAALDGWMNQNAYSPVLSS